MSLFFSYHTGSLAFGAAIIAVVKLIRITLEYIHKKLKGTLEVCFFVYYVNNTRKRIKVKIQSSQFSISTIDVYNLGRFHF